MDHLCILSFVSHAFASVHCILVVTCWERANLLVLLVMFIVFLLLSHVVWYLIYRFLIFASFLTFILELNNSVKFNKCVFFFSFSRLVKGI